MFHDPITSAVANYPLVRALSNLYFTGRGGSVAQDLAPYLGGEAEVVLVQPGEFPTPTVCFVRRGPEVVLLFLGVDSLSSARSFFLGYLTAALPGPFPLHPSLLDAQRFVQNPGVLPLFAAGNLVTLAGYSYGGCYAHACSVFASQQVAGVTCKVVTCGMPRCTIDPAARAPANVSLYRYMNEEDPIVYLPLHSDEAPNPLNGAPQPLSLGDRWWHPSSVGEVLYADGRRLTVPYPPLAAAASRVSQLGWATGLLAAPVLGHSIGRYEARLRNAVGLTIGRPPSDDPLVQGPPAVVSPVPPAPTKGRGAKPVAPLPPEVTRQIEAIGAGSVVKPYYAVKVSGVWWVYHNADRLFQVKGGRAARRAAARLNTVLAAWLRSPVGDVDALLTSVAEEFPPE